jgi:flagellar hook-length control protein FliK
MEAILPVLNKMQLFSNPSGSKKSLFVSTADVLSLRGTDKTFMSYPIKNNLLSVYSANETEMTSFLENLAPKNKDSVFVGELSASSDEPAKLGQVSQLDTLNNKLRSSGIEILNPKDFANINSRLNILEAQFNSRLAAIALDQALEANEPIELNLEPQSFGKIKVTAMFEKSGLDVRLLSDNNAALSILRSSEAILSQILEQNGVKLANYSAEMSFGGNSNDGSSNQNASQHNKGPLSEELITNDQKRNDENDVDDTHLLDMLA